MSGPARNGGANGLLLASTTSGGMNGTTTVAPRAHPRGATADHAGDKAIPVPTILLELLKNRRKPGVLRQPCAFAVHAHYWIDDDLDILARDGKSDTGAISPATVRSSS
jgi:hypothetical protein